MLIALGRLIATLERCYIAIAVAVMMSIMLIIVVDVACRYLFNAPLAWAFDLISLYLMAALFFFTLSDTLRARRHVNVDIVYLHLSPRWRAGADLLTSLLALIFFLPIFERGLARAAGAFVSGDVLTGPIAWPTWIYYGLVPVGVAVILLRLLLQAARFLLIAGGRTDITAPEEGNAEDEALRGGSAT